MKKIFTLIALVVFLISNLFGQEEEGSGQSRESMAVDATASQWSYQFAYEGFYDYKNDEIEEGIMRPDGRKGFFQFRMVAPIPKSEKIPLTLLPRLTFRLQENPNGEYGFGTSDLFVLGIVDEWATGRWGIGPQINFPAQEGFGNTNWGYGLAGAVTQRALDDKLFLAFLVQQTWSKGDDDVTRAGALSLNPIIVYQLGKGYYVGNGDYVINYSWKDNAFFVPFGARFGRAFIKEKSTFNAYLEYASSVSYNDWTGPVPGHSWRINIQWQLPVKL